METLRKLSNNTFNLLNQTEKLKLYCIFAIMIVLIFIIHTSFEKIINIILKKVENQTTIKNIIFDFSILLICSTISFILYFNSLKFDQNSTVSLGSFLITIEFLKNLSFMFASIQLFVLVARIFLLFIITKKSSDTNSHSDQ